MRSVAALCVLLALAPGCTTLRGVVGGGDGERMELWEQAHDAYARDSFRVAAAAFQRLAAEFPRTHEGHEARFYLAALSLEPRSGVNLDQADQHLTVYLAEDDARSLRGYHGREGETLLQLVRQLRAPCDQRVPGLGCLVQTVTERDTVTQRAPAGDGAEAARLRRELAERDRTIRELRDELQRIRNTLAPPRPRQD
ncbi:MAG TPA: hypothetical protein VFX98_14215 [Longimicrobiaceae bacterium]|nr:hypothetical protein [Longimicrobiaceae bacterium]